MCENKDLARSKIDVLIRSIDRLARALEENSIGKPVKRDLEPDSIGGLASSADLAINIS